MPAPAARYKLLPARGAYASLAAALADIAEGEIVYATDQDLYYQKEGGVLTPVGVPEAPNDGTQYVRQNQSWAAVEVPPGTIIGTSAALPGTIEIGQLWYDTDTARTFVYTGTEWADASPDAANATVITADNPPANPEDGDLWFDTSDGSGRLYVYYVDADSSQWIDASPDSTGEWVRDDATGTVSPATAGDDVDLGTGDLKAANAQVASLNSGPLAGFRNLLINSRFDIWQRGTNGGGVGYQTADRWRLGSNAPNLQRVFPPDSDGIPCGVAGRLTGGAGGALIRQAIELPEQGRRAPFVEGTVWTLSWYSTNASQTAADTAVRFSDDSAGLNQTDFTESNFQTIETLASGWTRYSVNYTAPAGFTGSNACVNVQIAGPTDGSAVDLTGIQLEPGPVATPLEIRPIGTELALCQRYYESSTSEQGSQIFFSGDVTNNFFYYTTTRFATPKRVAPTITNQHGAASGFNTNPSDISGQDVYAFRATRVSTSTVAGGFYIDTWQADAEL